MAGRASTVLPEPCAAIGPVPAWLLVNLLRPADVDELLAVLPGPHQDQLLFALADLRRIAELASPLSPFPQSETPETVSAADTAQWGSSRELTVQEAAEINLTPRRWRQLALAGVVEARRVAGRWLIDEEAARDYLRARTDGAP